MTATTDLRAPARGEVAASVALLGDLTQAVCDLRDHIAALECEVGLVEHALGERIARLDRSFGGLTRRVGALASAIEDRRMVARDARRGP